LSRISLGIQYFYLQHYQFLKKIVFTALFYNKTTQYYSPISLLVYAQNLLQGALIAT